MKIYENKHVPARDVKVCTKRQCDLCGFESNDDWDWNEPKWDDSETEVSINARRAKSYGNDGDCESCEIDLCPKCFWDKLIPWLRSQGVKVEIKESSW